MSAAMHASAPRWKRVLAAVLDFLLVYIVAGGALMLTVGSRPTPIGRGVTVDLRASGLGFELEGWPVLVLFSLVAIYFIALPRMGGTIMQRLFGLPGAPGPQRMYDAYPTAATKAMAPGTSTRRTLGTDIWAFVLCIVMFLTWAIVQIYLEEQYTVGPKVSAIPFIVWPYFMMFVLMGLLSQLLASILFRFSNNLHLAKMSALLLGLLILMIITLNMSGYATFGRYVLALSLSVATYVLPAIVWFVADSSASLISGPSGRSQSQLTEVEPEGVLRGARSTIRHHIEAKDLYGSASQVRGSPEGDR